MKNFLLQYRVGTRLATAFVVLIVIAMSIVGSGLWALSQAERSMDRIVKESMERIRFAKTMSDSNMEISVALRDLILTQDKKMQGKLLTEIDEYRREYDAARDALYATIAGEEEHRNREEIKTKRIPARAVNDAIISAVSKGDLAGASSALNVGNEKMEAWQAAIYANANIQQKLAGEAYRDAQAVGENARKMLVGGGIAAVLLSIILAITITRSVTGPLSQATKTADAIASGDIENVITPEGRDETAALLGSMSAMQNRIKALIADQKDMATAQAEGQTGYRIDSAAHPGAFGRLVGDTNSMVERSNAVTTRIVDIAQHYAVGDMSARMESLPGDQAAITEAMEATRTNLLAMNEEIRRLVKAAAAGDFSQRGDAERFSYSFREMVDNLNQMFDVSDRSLSDIARLLEALAASRIVAKMPLKSPDTR